MVEINFMKVVEGSDVNLYNLGQTSVEFSGKTVVKKPNQ